MGLLTFGVSLAETAPGLRGWAALGLLISALIAARGLNTAPGTLGDYVDVPGGRQ